MHKLKLKTGLSESEELDMGKEELNWKEIKGYSQTKDIILNSCDWEGVLKKPTINNGLGQNSRRPCRPKITAPSIYIEVNIICQN